MFLYGLEASSALQAPTSDGTDAAKCWEGEISRPRMSDAEREVKRKARSAFSFSNAAYRHYNPEKQGYGSPDEWESIAEALFGKVVATSAMTKYYNILEVTPPIDMLQLTSAFRRAMFKAHPDHGGTNAAARIVLEAYQMLKNYLRRG